MTKPRPLWIMLATVQVAALAAFGQERASPRVSEKRVQELQSLRFGMFICWSFSTFSGREWTQGVKDVQFFKPTGCDTDQWARTAREAGMGYILFLTKHHDGFCLWDTKTTNWNVTKSPLGIDVLAQLRKSCDRHGIKLALYFSEGDWTWPGKKGTRSGDNPAVKKAQLQELLTRYGPIEYIWFDHATGTGGLSHPDTIAWCKAIEPDCFIGFNHGDQAGADIRLGERGRPGPLSDHGAAGKHMRAPPSKSYRVAEFTYPIQPSRSRGAQWFYSLPENEDACHPAEALYKDYLGALKYDNLFSLDVGPMPSGKLRPIDVRTLRKVGRYIRGELEPPRPPVSQGKPARASSEWKGSAGHAATAAFDGRPDSRWGASEGSRSGWLEVDLGKPTAIRRAVIDEGHWNRVREFVVEARQAGVWKVVARGKTIGASRTITFDSIQARVFRLHIIEAVEVPTILEFQLFE